MAYASAEDLAYCLFDGVDVKTSNNTLTVNEEAIVVHRRALGSAYKTAFITGHKDGGLTMNGWLDSTTQATLADKTGDLKVVSILHEGNTAGLRCYNIQAAYIGGRSVTVAEEDLDEFEPTIVVDGAVDYGFVVAPVAARTTASNTQATYVDLGAAAASGGRLYMNVTAINAGGGNGVTVTLQHSTDHNTWADHGTGALTKTAAVGAQCLSIAAAVNQYIAVKWVWDGGTNPTFTAFVGFAAN